MTGLRRIAQFAFVAVCSAVISCASDTTELQATVDNILLTLGLNTLTVGQTVQAGAIARDASGGSLNGIAIAWSSSNTAVATVTSSGMVTAVAPGTAVITASASGKSVTANITVVNAAVASVSVSLSANNASVGEPVTATATTRDANGNVLTGRAIAWTSTNTTVATVSSAGAVTTIGQGSTNIMAVSEGVTGVASLTVGQVSVNTVSVSLGSASIAPNGTTTATATLRDASNNVLTGRPITWSSGNIAVATVDASGNVVGVTPGAVAISATADGKTGSATLTVQAGVASVSVSLGINPINVGATSTATATTRDASGTLLTGRVVTWSSSSSAVATVNSSGIVQGVGPGSATITATSEGVTGSAVQTVQSLAATVAVTIASPSLKVASTTAASAVVRDANNTILTGRAIAWSSSNSAVATIAPDGTILGVTVGTAIISAKVDTAVGSANLTVTSSGGGGGGGPTATQLAITTQPGNAVSGVNFTTPAVVAVEDATNAVVPGNTVVAASIVSGNGTLSGATAVAAVNGVATFTNLHVNGSGPFTLTFTSTGLTSATSASFNVTQVPASLTFQTQPSGAVTGSLLTTQPVLRILDNAGLLISNSTATVTASVASGTATLVGTTQVAAVGGVATFTNLQLNGTGVAVIAFSISNPSVQVQSSPIGVAQGPPTHLSVLTQPAGAASGLTIGTQPVVMVADASNAAVFGATNPVTAAITSGTGTLSGTTTVNAVNGIATFASLKISGVGPHTLTFTSPALTSAVSASFNVPQVPAALVLQTQPGGGAVSGSPLGAQPVVEIRDNAGLLIANSTLTVSAAISSGSGTLGGTTQVSAVAGVATFTNLQVNGTGNFVLRFSISSPPVQVTSAQFNVGAQAGTSATQLAISQQPGGAVSGVNLTTQPVVQIRDANNVIVNSSTATVSVAITSGTGALAGSTNVNAVNGVATFTNLRINGTGPHTLTFTSAGLTSAVANPVTPTQNVASLSVQTQPAGAVTGSNLVTQPVVRILDNAGLLVANSTLLVSVARTTGTAILTGTTSVNAVAGVATFTNLRLDGTGNNVLTFSTAAPALQVASASFAVGVGPAAKLGIATQPGLAVSGVPFTTQPVIQVQDIAGSLVPSSNAPITATIAAGPGVLSGTTQINAVGGVATYTNLVITGVGSSSIQFASGALTPVTSNALNITVPGNLSGTIVNQSAAPVGGGYVELLAGTTVIRSVTVAGNGTYTIPNIAPGTYGARLQPTLAYSMGPAEPAQQTVTINSNATTNQGFTVQSAMYSDDFQSYTSTAQLLGGCNQASIPAGAFFAGAGGDMSCQPQVGTLPISLDLAAPGGVGKAMRYDWPARPSSGVSGNYTVALQPRFNPAPAQGSSLYIRWTDYLSSNFRIGGSGATGAQLEYKYLFIDVLPTGTGVPLGTYVFELDSQTTPITDLFTVRTKLIDFRNQATDSDPFNHPLGTGFIGQWHTWVAEITGIGTASTTFNIWLDGVMIQSIAGPFFPGTALGGPGSIMTIEMGANINNGPDQVQQRWFREFGVYKTRPSMRAFP